MPHWNISQFKCSPDQIQPLEFPVSPPASIQQPESILPYIPTTGVTSDPPSSLETPFQLSPTSSTQKAGPSLAVYCLGTFRVYQNDKEIIEWQSLKSRSIFKYLLTHPETPVAKDILMDLFWPDAAPEAARRNLHQAIYSLRQLLGKEQTDFLHIRFENDRYFLNPEIDIWLDFKEFERYVNAGRFYETAGKQAMAIEQYGIADNLYQGEFLEEDMYEDWLQSKRQFFYNMYMEIIDRMSRYYFHQGEHFTVITLCRKLLAKDKSYEEAHRRLMQCYLAQGQRHLALRQYQLCVKMLREELNMTPTPETTALYEQIRQVERI